MSTNPTPHGSSPRVGPPIGADAGQDAASSRGSAAHHSKMATHNAQLQGAAGATTGGLGTSPGAPSAPNATAKTASEGKVKGSR